MAMLLKREYNLAALKVTLQTATTPAVRIELELTEHHQPETVWETSFPVEAIGLRSRQETEQANAGVDQFQLPAGFVEELRGALEHFEYGGPLWLHLVKPYGLLGAFPWERLLQAVPNPILRLPDAITRQPAEIPRTLDVLLCASRPLSEEAFHIPGYLARMCERIVQAVQGRQVRLHVFTDLQCVNELNSRIAQAGITAHVQVYPPVEPRSLRGRRSMESTSRPSLFGETNSWLMWMLDAMQGKSVDVVHFLCHGYRAHDGGALAFAQSPVSNYDPEWCGFASAAELNLFLLKIGAWGIGFSSPERNYSELGLRLLFDEFAQQRPGPVMHHDSASDPDFFRFAEMYRFVFSRTRTMPSPNPSVALCCQPFLLPGSEHEVAAARSISLGFAPEAEPDQLPGWLASAHRVLELQEFELQMNQRDQSRSKVRSDRAAGLARGVDEIRETLQRLAKKGIV